MKKSNRTKELLLEHLRKAPIVEVACQKIGVSRMTFYRWKKEDPDFARNAEEAMLDGCLLINDLAESQLVNAIKERNMPSIAYWLKHNSPKYSNRLEITGKFKTEQTLTPEQEQLIQKAMKMAGIIAPAPEEDKETPI